MVEEGRAVADMKRLLAQPTTYELYEAFVKGLPPRWRELPPYEQFERLRCLVTITQDQVARRAGLHQSAVSKLEGGRDSKLSTWRKAYDAMGFDLILLPIPRGTAAELRKLAATDRATRRWWRQHARPRRRRMRERAAEQAAPAPPSTAPSGTPRGPSSRPR